MSGALDSIDAGKLKLTEKAGTLLEEHKQLAIKAGRLPPRPCGSTGNTYPGQTYRLSKNT